MSWRRQWPWAVGCEGRAGRAIALGDCLEHEHFDLLRRSPSRTLGCAIVTYSADSLVTRYCNNRHGACNQPLNHQFGCAFASFVQPRTGQHQVMLQTAVCWHLNGLCKDPWVRLGGSNGTLQPTEDPQCPPASRNSPAACSAGAPGLKHGDARCPWKTSRLYRRRTLAHPNESASFNSTPLRAGCRRSPHQTPPENESDFMVNCSLLPGCRKGGQESFLTQVRSLLTQRSDRQHCCLQRQSNKGRLTVRFLACWPLRGHMCIWTPFPRIHPHRTILLNYYI